MFTNLELFLQEKEVYNQKVEEIKSSSATPEDLQKNLAEAEEQYKGQVRKYLSSAINVINTNFQCQYSIYKVGKDFDVNFQVVETNIRKTRPEVIAEMEEFKKQAASMNLTNDQITKINIAMEVLLTYSEDAVEQVDENKEVYLNQGKVVATSIIEAPTRKGNAFEPAPTPEPSFNPYANQPIELDNGFKNPEYERKTLVDPFANIYGGGNVPPTAIPEATPDFGVPTPPVTQNLNNPAPNTQPSVMSDAMSIFGAGISMTPSAPVQPSVPMSNNQAMATPMNTYEPNTNSYNVPVTNGVPNNAFGDNSMNQGMNMNYSSPAPIPVMENNGVGVAVPNSVPVNVSAVSPESAQQDTLIANNEVKENKESACIISKLMKGILRLPITTLLFLGIIVLIFFGLDKANLMAEISNSLGDYMGYAELALVLFIMVIASSSVLDAMSTKTKYISKHAMASLVLFSGVTWGLMKLGPYLITEVLPDMLDADILIQVSLYFSYYLALSFFIGTFTWLFAFIRNDKSILKKKNLNFLEILGLIACIYTIIIPAVIAGCEWCEFSIVGEKISFIYEYANCDWIIIGASFALGFIMLLFSKIEEKKL